MNQRERAQKSRYWDLIAATTRTGIRCTVLSSAHGRKDGDLVAIDDEMGSVYKFSIHSKPDEWEKGRKRRRVAEQQSGEFTDRKRMCQGIRAR
jgi:hypothetical protein